MPPSAIQKYRDPFVNRGLATPGASDLAGLLPAGAGAGTAEVEVSRARAALARGSPEPLEVYQRLVTLLMTNARVFYTLMSQSLEALLPVVYTPGIGDACLAWGSLLPRPIGLTVSLADLNRVQSVLDKWPYDQVRLAVVTDGERILGLGDLGAHGMGIPVGKCMVHAICAGLDPRQLLPISVDCGCNQATLVQDELYLGLRRPRERGPAYDALMDELVAALQSRYGPGVVVHWEDLGSSNSWRLLQRYQARRVTTFNDDIQCTAGAAVAAVLAACRIRGVPALASQSFLFFGAGQASLGIAALLVRAMVDGGVAENEAVRRITLIDSRGFVSSQRQDLTPEKRPFAVPSEALTAQGLSVSEPVDLEEAVTKLKPTTLIGAAAVPGSFTQGVIASLTKSVQAAVGTDARPVVLALSNPASKSECSAADAYVWSGGAAVFASGTAFPPVRAAPTPTAAMQLGQAVAAPAQNAAAAQQSGLPSCDDDGWWLHWHGGGPPQQPRLHLALHQQQVGSGWCNTELVWRLEAPDARAVQAVGCVEAFSGSPTVQQAWLPPTACTGRDAVFKPLSANTSNRGARALPAVMPRSHPAASSQAAALAAPEGLGEGGQVVMRAAQANNSFIFPGVALGTLVSGADAVTEDMLYAAARAVAGTVQEGELLLGSVLPGVSRLQEVTRRVAAAVAVEACITMRVSTACPITPDSRGTSRVVPVILQELSRTRAARFDDLAPAALERIEAQIASEQWQPFVSDDLGI